MRFLGASTTSQRGTERGVSSGRSHRPACGRRQGDARHIRRQDVIVVHSCALVFETSTQPSEAPGVTTIQLCELFSVVRIFYPAAEMPVWR